MAEYFLLYINYLQKVIRSHLRLILTLSGLVLSVIVLFIGLVFSETYFASKYSTIEIYNKNKASK